jgi:hypothetical protein
MVRRWRLIAVALSYITLSRTHSRLGYIYRLTAEEGWQVSEEFLLAEVTGEGAFRLENQLWQSRTHRKMHLELATGARGLEVLHCVMFPRVDYDLPIFAMDMVGFGGRVTLCIADLCPIRDNPQVLPPSPFDLSHGESW